MYGMVTNNKKKKQEEGRKAQLYLIAYISYPLWSLLFTQFCASLWSYLKTKEKGEMADKDNQRTEIWNEFSTLGVIGLIFIYICTSKFTIGRFLNTRVNYKLILGT